MTLLDAENQPRQILEISGYMRHAHPAVSDYRMARCPGDWLIMVFDQGIYRISKGASNGEGGQTKKDVPK